ncbi:MAG: ATP-binding cassette domain-containing protein [Deltaproteobacteria bacterium]|jgi:putative ABC transport system ATP-binding protein|nr:ATP-binding cassette domain-containing protein [Deltaproteobacteria bacterium]
MVRAEPRLSSEEAAPPAVSLRAVSFAWPGQENPVLHIPELTIKAGERLFIFGPSGSGKSTLLGLLSGVLTASEGEVSVQGTALHKLGGAARDRFRGDHVGVIFQQFNLVPYLSILENVLIPCRFSARRAARAARQAGSAALAARNLLECLDLRAELWERRVAHLSVGQQQRVAAARALIGGPELLIADEPTSSLDADRRRDFLRLLLRECENSGSTLIFVSHDQGLAAEFSSAANFEELNRRAGR